MRRYLVVFLAMLVILSPIVFSKTYIVYHKEMPKTKIYAVEHKKEAQDKELRLNLQERMRHHRARQFRYDEQDEELERCIDKITRNWERHCEMCEKRDIFGFDEEEDAMFKLGLKERLKKGERIC